MFSEEMQRLLGFENPFHILLDVAKQLREMEHVNWILLLFLNSVLIILLFTTMFFLYTFYFGLVHCE